MRLHYATMPTSADHLLAFAIAVGLPLRAWVMMRHLRTAAPSDVPRVRRTLWTRAILMQWTLVAAVALLWWMNHRSPIGLHLRLEPTPGLAGVLVGLATIVSLVLRTRSRLDHEPEARERARQQLTGLERLLPRTAAEGRFFAVLAVTAGVCEELLFRGFLVWYLGHFMPPMLALATQAALFGLAHAYQGRAGVLKTGFAGAFFTGVVVVSGSVLPAMLIHALMDLHAGDVARRVLPVDDAV
ncbi:MAG: hypothetical protein RL721_182 [Candidatus Eisenbacteria bacterium]|jgi:membrane protease YdiL (CAAX protease family)